MLRWRRAGQGCAKTAAVGAGVAHLGRPLGSVCMCAFLFCADKRVAHTTVVDARPPCAPPVPNVKAVYRIMRVKSWHFCLLPLDVCSVWLSFAIALTKQAAGDRKTNELTAVAGIVQSSIDMLTILCTKFCFYLYHTFACTFYFCCSTFVRMCTRLYSLAYQSNIISVLL